jgi:hypothetical protein
MRGFCSSSTPEPNLLSRRFYLLGVKLLTKVYLQRFRLTLRQNRYLELVGFHVVDGQFANVVDGALRITYLAQHDITPLPGQVGGIDFNFGRDGGLDPLPSAAFCITVIFRSARLDDRWMP